jgi:flavin reductase (DIM6/NTAB) family NADH-FMN oxidoreductase RutF
MTIDPKEIPVPKMHGYLLAAVAPRPIAFASTVDKDGNVNLSPFSFFNVFSANPPILIFSPARRGRDNTTKHTYENVKEHAEVVINIVNYDMVEQMSLASTEYAKGVDEFIKAGFTKKPSERVKPPRVLEAPVSFECKVNQVIELGQNGGAGNLIICEVLLMHIADKVLDKNGAIDPQKIDQVARMGADWYTRAKVGTFEVAKPLTTIGIGYDAIPKAIRNSQILTGNHLGKLGNIEQLPTDQEVAAMGTEPEVTAILTGLDGDIDQQIIELHKLAAIYLDRGEVMNAWKVLLQP